MSTDYGSVFVGTGTTGVDGTGRDYGYERLTDANPGLNLLSESGGNQSGSANIAKVHRAEWEDYLARFAPIENMLFEKFNDAEGRAEAVESAGLTAGGAFDQSREQTDRTMKRYGLNLSNRQQKQRDQQQGLNKALAVAGAKNTMRDAKEDQRMSIMTGGLPAARKAGA